jgi:hypothetical protein
MINSPESDRANSAIARMNFIHGVYQKSGHISNDDLLYTLSLFALEPYRWVNMYEWRQLTDIEICALGCFWKAHGDAMGISYKALPSDGHWASGLHFFRELEAWSTAYESEQMVPHIDNRDTANKTIDLLLFDIPESMHPPARLVVSSLLDKRLRTAVMCEEPPVWLERTLKAGLSARRYLLRHLALPRPWLLRKRSISEKPDENGRLHMLQYDAEPWYDNPQSNLNLRPCSPKTGMSKIHGGTDGVRKAGSSGSWEDHFPVRSLTPMVS